MNLAAVVVVDIADIVVDHTAAAVMLLRPPRDKDSKSGLSFALRRPGAEIIDILYFGSIVEVTVCLHADVWLQLALFFAVNLTPIVVEINLAVDLEASCYVNRKCFVLVDTNAIIENARSTYISMGGGANDVRKVALCRQCCFVLNLAPSSSLISTLPKTSSRQGFRKWA